MIRLFQKLRREKPRITIEINQIPRWITIITEKKGLKKITDEYKKKISENTNKIITIIRNLEEKKEQKNPYLLTIKKRLIESLKEFLETSRMPEDTIQSAVYAQKIAEKIEEMSEEQLRRINKLMEQHPEDMKNLMIIIQRMDKETSEYIRETNKEEHKQIIRIRRMYEQYNKIKEQIRKYDEEKKALEEEKKEPEKRLGKIEKRLEELKNSNNYKALEKKIMKKEELEKELEEKGRTIITIIITIKKALEIKARKDKRKDLIRKYLEEPLKTIIEDQSLIISEIMKELKKELEKKTMKKEIKEKELKKIRKTIEETTKEKLMEERTKIKRIMEEKEEIENMIIRNTTRMLVSEQEHQKKLVEETINHINNKIRIIERKKEPLSIKLEYQKLRDEIKKINPRLLLKPEE